MTRLFLARLTTLAILFNLATPAFASSTRLTDDPPPAPADTAGAYSRGSSDGQSVGYSEGQQKGAVEGQAAGQSSGYNDGFSDCSREIAQRERDRGYRDGYRERNDDGIRDGRNQGQNEGDRKGSDDGRTDGINRAQSDALAQATGPGRAAGERDADNSDADTRGRADGLAAGSAAALYDAQTYDYGRGRSDENAAHFAEPIDHKDSFSQIQNQKLTQLAPQTLKTTKQETSATPTKIAKAVSNPYTNPEEAAAYDSGYQAGYSSGYNSGYHAAYDQAYRSAADSARNQGCSEARSRSYQSDYNNGEYQGRQEGYDAGVRDGYNQTYQSSYDYAFRNSSQNAYNQNFQDFYNRVFDQARQEAYRRHYDEIYNSYFSSAKRERYDQVYPGLAAQYYAKGRKDENQDFIDMPVRLLDAAVTETDGTGLFQPGANLHVKVTLRNFATSGMRASSLQLRLVGAEAGVVNLSRPQESLVRDLNSRSVTEVSGALEFQLLEGALKKDADLKLQLVHNGRVVGEENLSPRANYIDLISFAAVPQLQEGIPAKVRILVKNQSKLAAAAAGKVTLSSASDKVEITQATAALPTLSPGQETELEFIVIARAGGASLSIPFTLVAADGNDKRLGLLETVEQMPIVNEYNIKLTNSIAGLRKAGITRATYVIKNLGKRVVTKSLQLYVSVLGPNGANFNVVGPSPEVLNPVSSGKQLNFMIPVNAKKDNSGGTLQLEVKEAGQTVVISRVNF